MLGINSSVKNITERLNPLSQRNKISKLKFERKKDYKTFLDFIKKNTKEIEGTGVDGVKEKLSKGVLGLGGIGIIAALFGGGSGLDPVGEGNRRFNTLQNVVRKRKADAKNISPNKSRGNNIQRLDDTLDKSRAERISKKVAKKNIIKKQREQRKINKRYVRNLKRFQQKFNIQEQISEKTNQNTIKEVGGDSTSKSSVSTKNRQLDLLKDAKKINKKNNQLSFDDFFPKQDPYDTNKDLKKLIKSNRFLDKEVGGDSTSKSSVSTKNRQNDINFKNLKRFFSGEIGSDDLDNLIKIDRMFEKDGNRPIKMFDRRPSLSERFMFNPNTNRAGGSRFTSLGNFFNDQSFTAPAIPKRKKLSNLDNFNRFSGNILNNPFVRLTSSVLGFVTNFKGELIRTSLTPTPFEDGTIQAVMDINGKLPGQEGYDIKTKGQFNSEDRVLKITVIGNRENDNNTENKLNNDVIPPTDFPTPSSNVFIDPKQQLNIDDLFFLRSFSGG